MSSDIDKASERLRQCFEKRDNGEACWISSVYDPEVVGDYSNNFNHDLQTVARDYPRLTARVKELEGELDAWRQAMATIRDAVLHERYQLAEENAGPDVINSVLGIIDDYTPMGEPGRVDTLTSEIARLKQLLGVHRDG